MRAAQGHGYAAIKKETKQKSVTKIKYKHTPAHTHTHQPPPPSPRLLTQLAQEAVRQQQQQQKQQQQKSALGMHKKRVKRQPIYFLTNSSSRQSCHHLPHPLDITTDTLGAHASCDLMLPLLLLLLVVVD